MPGQHQDSLLPASRQGEEGHETTQYSCVVRINSVCNAINIHLSDSLVALRIANTR